MCIVDSHTTMGLAIHCFNISITGNTVTKEGSPPSVSLHYDIGTGRSVGVEKKERKKEAQVAQDSFNFKLWGRVTYARPWEGGSSRYPVPEKLHTIIY